MYFYLKKRKQHLDLEGSLILRKTPRVSRCSVRSAHPAAIHGGSSAYAGSGARFSAAYTALSYIFGPVRAAVLVLSALAGVAGTGALSVFLMSGGF